MFSTYLCALESLWKPLAELTQLEPLSFINFRPRNMWLPYLISVTNPCSLVTKFMHFNY